MFLSLLRVLSPRHLGMQQVAFEEPTFEDEYRSEDRDNSLHFQSFLIVLCSTISISSHSFSAFWFQSLESAQEICSFLIRMWSQSQERKREEKRMNALQRQVFKGQLLGSGLPYILVWVFFCGFKIWNAMKTTIQIIKRIIETHAKLSFIRRNIAKVSVCLTWMHPCSCMPFHVGDLSWKSRHIPHSLRRKNRWTSCKIM